MEHDTIETQLFKDIRVRTFSHWVGINPNRIIQAGFFSCNCKDQVICMYCDLIWKDWKDEDDPVQIHKTLSPNCPYVQTVHDLSILDIPDTNIIRSDSTFSPEQIRLMIHTRMSLPISIDLMKTFSKSIIFDCYQQQLTIKGNDFKTNSDLLIACTIKDKLTKATLKIIPSVPDTSKNLDTSVELSNVSNMSNACRICMIHERRLACFPCGHFSICMKCSDKTNICPICAGPIDRFIKIYT